MLILLLMAGCTPETSPEPPTTLPLPPLTAPTGTFAVANQQHAMGDISVSPQRVGATRSLLVPASGPSLGTPPTRPGIGLDGMNDGIRLNFVNAPVAEVASAVLGDFLRLNYVLAGNLQGSVTLQTSSPIPRAAVLPALEMAFQLAGLALIDSPEGWRIVPLAEAARADPALRGRGGQSAGYGVEIVPLRFVSAEAMQQILDPMMPPGSVLRADPARNLLMIGATASERAAIADNIAMFDINSLAGQNAAMFTLGAGEARTVAHDLMEAIGPALSGMVRIVPIPRLNAILAFSTQRQYLDQLRGWVIRLDQPPRADERRLHIYHVQNGRAKDLAGVLSRVLGGGAESEAPAASPAAEAKASDAKPAGLADLLGEVNAGGLRIVPDGINNVLLINANGRDWSMLQAALANLDIPPTQVLIEATIAEVTLTNDLNFGLQYYFHAGGSRFIQSFSPTAAIAPMFPGAGYVLGSGATPQVVINALEAVTTVNVVSDPEILVLNNQTAELKVGDQVPVAVQSAVSVATAGAPVVNSIEFRDTGVILKVTPRVNQNGLVLMDVSQEVSGVAPTTSSTLNSPTIQQRKITSAIAVQDGETVALGGLIKDNDERGLSGIPYLKDVPVLGHLFSNTTNNKTRTELLVMLTPRVVHDAQTLRGITADMREHIKATQPLLLKHN